MSRARQRARTTRRVAAGLLALGSALLTPGPALLTLGSVLVSPALANPQPAETESPPTPLPTTHATPRPAETASPATPPPTTDAAVASASSSPSVRLTATVASTPATEATERHPVALDPGEALRLDLRIDNDTDDDLSVRAVRVEGRVMGLTFFSYDTRVGIEVPAHGTATRRYPLDLVGLRGQATGLVPARIVALGPDRRPVASQDLVVDVRGSARSVYGAFGLAVAAFTAVSLAGALLALARHRLSPNRWRRAVRFTWPGIGVGLLLVFTLSAFRVFVPLPHRWVPILAVSTIALFVLGYLTPTPDEPDQAAEPADGSTGLSARRSAATATGTSVATSATRSTTTATEGSDTTATRASTTRSTTTATEASTTGSSWEPARGPAGVSAGGSGAREVRT